MVGGAIRKGLLVGTACFLGNGEEVIATPQMTARMEPKVGDYWVIQSDGYVYLNPKEVFERKYEPVEMNALELGATARQVGNSGY
jgi:hypothetical protein